MADLNEELFWRIGDGVRAFHLATGMFDEAIDSYFKLNRTDGRCIEILDTQGPSLPAGELAKLAGMTTGALTSVIDRLVRDGWVRRDTDPADGRRVLVTLDEKRRAERSALFDGVHQRSHELLEGFEREQLEAIAQFLQFAAQLTSEYEAELNARNPKRRGPRKSASAS